MNITDNLKKDISNAPEWFQDAIVSKSEVKVLEAELGNVSYKCWGKGTNDKTIVLIPVSYTHLTLPTICSV